MASKAQRKATKTHRRRAAARGLVRLEVQALKRDADLIRALAETLRDKSEKAKVLRSTLVKALVHPEIRTAFDVFGSDFPTRSSPAYSSSRANGNGARSIFEVPARHEHHFRDPGKFSFGKDVKIGEHRRCQRSACETAAMLTPPIRAKSQALQKSWTPRNSCPLYPLPPSGPRYARLGVRSSSILDLLRSTCSWQAHMPLRPKSRPVFD